VGFRWDNYSVVLSLGQRLSHGWRLRRYPLQNPVLGSAQTFVADTQRAKLQKKQAGPRKAALGTATGGMWWFIGSPTTWVSTPPGVRPFEALVHVTGVSGANSKKFRSYQEAQTFTTGHERLEKRFVKSNRKAPHPHPRL
jgi:hypothetical protein